MGTTMIARQFLLHKLIGKMDVERPMRWGTDQL